jgi:hypothetical protein
MIGLLGLASCGSEDQATTQAGTSSASQAPSPLAETADSLCNLYCDDLEAGANMCPDLSNLVPCSQPMAAAKDALDSIEAELLSVEPDLQNVAPEMDEALEDSFEFYEDWSVTPTGEFMCGMLVNVEDPVFPRPMVGRCTSAAGSMQNFLPYVAEQLQAVAKS